jgi:hypothetical protein
LLPRDRENSKTLEINIQRRDEPKDGGARPHGAGSVRLLKRFAKA